LEKLIETHEPVEALAGVAGATEVVRGTGVAHEFDRAVEYLQAAVEELALRGADWVIGVVLFDEERGCYKGYAGEW